MSLPSGGVIIDPMDHLSGEHREQLLGLSEPMLRPGDSLDCVSSAADVIQPHIDPAFNSAKVYASFLLDLHSRNLIEWQLGGKSFLGVFFVEKKNKLTKRTKKIN